jgi:hypothetical protein
MTTTDERHDSLEELRGIRGWLVVLLVFQFLVILREAV